MADVKDILNISTEKAPSRVESILVGKKRTPTATPKRKKPGIYFTQSFTISIR
jgi:hypothetical protein